MTNNKSPIVRLGMEVPSSFDTTTTIEEHSQDLKDFLNGINDDPRALNITIEMDRSRIEEYEKLIEYTRIKRMGRL